MIKSILAQNYKAFDKVNVDLKPITVFLGKNNIGKTSLLQLLLVLQNTRNIDQSNYKSALRLHGSFVSLGQNENIFKNKDTSKNVKIGFRIDEKEIVNKFSSEVILIDELLNRLSWELERYIYFTFKNLDKYKSISEINPSLFDDNKKKYINKIKRLKDKWEQVDKDKTSEKRIRKISSFVESVTFLQNNIKEFERIYEFANSVRKIKSKKLEIIFEIEYKKGDNKEDSKLSIANVEVLCDDELFLLLDIKNTIIKSNIIVESFLNPLYKSALKSRLNIPNSIFNFLNTTFIKNWPLGSKKNTLSLDLFLKFINIILEELKISFNEETINHVSPLRASPKRYYYVDRAKVHNILDTSDADSITDVIRENRDNIVDRTNKWLDNFNINIEVKTFKELIHTLRVTNKNYNLELDLTDVGFGISQVLPIILQGFLSNKKSITLIEQPEIHLHPKMQGDLADLFIEIVSDKEIDLNKSYKKYPSIKNNKILIIETHSEYFLYRLRRRISQRLISPNDIGLYFFFHSKNNGTVVKNIPIMDEGMFEWPHDFSTALEDTNAFLNNSKNLWNGVK